MARYLITGGDGMLAQAFRHASRFSSHTACPHSEVDITRPETIAAAIDRIRPEVLVNCAAYNNVTAAEKDDRDAFRVNATGTANLAAICRKKGILFVHFGTDYIFSDGEASEHLESDPVIPINRYAASKWAGERAIYNEGGDYLIVRVSWLYGPGGKNFVSSITKLLRQRDKLSVVSDQINKCTFTCDCVEAVGHLLDHNARGVFNFANEGILSRYEFAVQIAREMEKHQPVNCRISPIPAIKYPDPTPRPYNSAMATGKYKAVTGKSIPSWNHALERYMGMV